MHTITLNIDDGFYPHFKALLDSLVQNKKLAYTEKEYDNSINYPEGVVVNSVDEVQRRVRAAEQRISEGNYVEEEDFWQKIDQHMKQYDN